MRRPQIIFFNPFCIYFSKVNICQYVKNYFKFIHTLSIILILILIKYLAQKMTVKIVDSYKIHMEQILGSDQIGTVYKGYSQIDNTPVAVKMIQKPKDLSNDQCKDLETILLSEKKIMQLVKNPNIVQFIDVLQSKSNYYFFQQLCDGDITTIVKSGEQISEKYAIDMLTQLCNGLITLVRQGIVHRDLKPTNIMIKGKTIKLGGFGIAKIIPSQEFLNKTIAGSSLYMSIEILMRQDYTSKCDIWSLGVLFYQLLHGYTPWRGDSQYKLIKMIEHNPLEIKRKDLSENTQDFLHKCLGVYQKDRISWNQLFLHPIFEGFFDDKGNNKQFEAENQKIMNDS